jgi:poly-gamma-glutamate synthesis protein (capsule biosynthesis protein)
MRRFLALAGVLAASGCGAEGRGAPARTAPKATVAMLTAQSTPSPPPPTTLTVAVSGDLLIHQPVWDRALAAGHGHYDFRPELAAIRPIIRGADLALCHVETPLVPGPPSGYPVFRTPPALAKAIHWAGWDACDTASNHSLDEGQAGIDSTAAALDRAHVLHTGSFTSPAQRRHITMMSVKGVPVALLAYTAVSNGQLQPHPWSLNTADPRRIVADARRARRHGARVVIVNLHWGDEYHAVPSAAQVALARTLVRSRAITAIVGQHVHVVQAIRRVAGHIVVFGEGNLLSNQTAACCPTATQDGIIALLTIRAGTVGSRLARVRYVPTWVRHPDFTVLPVLTALRRGLAPRAELLASLRRTEAAVGRGAATVAHVTQPR